MPRAKISDLKTTPPNARIPNSALLTAETHILLDQLAQNLEARRDEFLPQLSRPLTAREYEKAFRTWVNGPLTDAQRMKAHAIGMNRGSEAVMDFYREEFSRQHPELSPNTRQGRPDWYVSPSRARRIAHGDIIALLINLGAEKLSAELASPTTSPLIAETFGLSNKKGS